MDVYFDVEFDGEEEILEAKTKEEAEKYLDFAFENYCYDDGIANGEIRTDEGYVLKKDVETDEVIERTPHTMTCEGYHGDYEEHNLNYRGGFL